jgi:N-acetyl-gamma-glutamyl-phosphate reductase
MKITIIGASGYTGSELLRILVNHSKIEEIIPTSRTYKGKSVSLLHQNLKNIFDEKFVELEIDKIDSDLVFTCTPNGEAMNIVPRLMEKGIKVIDMSADFRIEKDAYEKAYKIRHKCPELLKKAIYGLPELFREKIKKSNLTANPGCYVTAAVLGIAPLLNEKFKNNLDLDKVVVDAKSGTSGAGAELSEFLHFSEVYENLKPYKVVEHRHRPEIESALARFSETSLKVSFTPTLMPIVRGILNNIHIFVNSEANFEKEKLTGIYNNFYKNEPFIRLVDVPYVKNVVNTNYCDIGCDFDKHTKRILVMSAIDNLIKGASGQAVQNMNLMCGFSEKEGLEMIAGHP